MGMLQRDLGYTAETSMVVGKKRAEQRQSSEPLACRLTLLIVLGAFNEVLAEEG